MPTKQSRLYTNVRTQVLGVELGIASSNVNQK